MYDIATDCKRRVPRVAPSPKSTTSSHTSHSPEQQLTVHYLLSFFQTPPSFKTQINHTPTLRRIHSSPPAIWRHGSHRQHARIKVTQANEHYPDVPPHAGCIQTDDPSFIRLSQTATPHHSLFPFLTTNSTIWHVPTCLTCAVNSGQGAEW